MKSVRNLAILVAAGLYASACVETHDRADTSEKTVADKPVVVADKPFAGGGKIDLQLDGGGYEVHPAADDRIRVTLSGNIGNAKVELSADGAHADVKVKDTPRNFRAAIEVPKVADLVIRFSGGDLVMAPITGNKDVESYGGDIKIGVGDPNDYSSVDASVKAGDIDAGVFGGSKSGLLQRFTWSGHGKYTLRANLGAGDLVLRSK
jgi:hypothetical protein